MAAAGHRQLEHTADLALELWAPSEAALLEEGARALIEIMTEGAVVTAVDRREVALAALDPEDRLVRWLNEILVLAVSEGWLFASLEHVELDAAGALRASIRGERDAGARVRTELKSATYHQLSLTEREGTWRAQVIIDV
ncbi:MAG: archease [Deltaproteobacteria bacterium]|nr:archease [Deltaproteobacteria bacterium]